MDSDFDFDFDSKPDSQYVPIERDQLLQLELELSNFPDIAKSILNKFRITNLADVPKYHFFAVLAEIHRIKKLLESVEPEKK